MRRGEWRQPFRMTFTPFSTIRESLIAMLNLTAGEISEEDFAASIRANSAAV